MRTNKQTLGMYRVATSNTKHKEPEFQRNLQCDVSVEVPILVDGLNYNQWLKRLDIQLNAKLIKIKLKSPKLLPDTLK